MEFEKTKQNCIFLEQNSNTLIFLKIFRVGYQNKGISQVIYFSLIGKNKLIKINSFFKAKKYKINNLKN